MDIIRFPEPEPKPLKSEALERGVTEATVRRCIESIDRDGLDLEACTQKGGSWAEAARRIRAAKTRKVLLPVARQMLAGIRPEFLSDAPEIFRRLGATDPDLRMTPTCPDCGGKGIEMDMGVRWECAACHGTGRDDR